ncbi:MAG: M56 family metallopeptidase [Actinomycetota bacterium]|nr:M56 family metallopeptidase [Actinomycetota bacterium]
MTVAVSLAAYALAMAFGGPRLLSGRAWPGRSPRLAIGLWLSGCISVIGALMLAGLALAAPTIPFSVRIGEALQACMMAIQAAYASPGGALLVATGATFTVFVAARTFFALGRSWATAAAQRRAHRQAVALAGEHRVDLGALVVDCDQAAAYCLPGRQHKIVLTSGALQALSQPQLDAVLAHERAHLRGRHHLLVGAAVGLAEAFPGVPLFQVAADEVAVLTEMLADDAATKDHRRATLATAMVAMASMRAPVVAMAASGTATLARVRRLANPAAPLPKAALLGGALLGLAVIALPVAAAAAPALHAMGMRFCPVHAGQLSALSRR